MVVSKEIAGKFVDGDFMQDISNAYQSSKFTDISFVLSDGLEIETNRFMLAWRSDYFASMFFGGLKEATSEKVTLQCNSQTFRLILDYIWEGEVDFSQLKVQSLVDLLESARMMCLDKLVGGIGEYMKYHLEYGKVELGELLLLLDFCVSNKFEEIEKLVLGFVGFNLATLTFNENFLKLSEDVILSILKYEERDAPEIDVFNALASWIKSQVPPVSISSKTEMLSLVDLVGISNTNLMKAVRKSGLYGDKAICDAIEEQVKMENVNVCLKDNGAQIVHGMEQFEGSCIRGPPHEYAQHVGYTYNKIDERISVKFKREYMINKVEFHLWDLDDREYAYILESSLDGINWTTILDCTMLDCISTQTIFFPSKPMKFISVKGTKKSFAEEVEDDEEDDDFRIVQMLATLDTTDSEKHNTGMSW